MNTDLEPPRVPPLSTAERARLRNQVIDRARPAPHRPGRRWIAPLVGVGAVAAVVAGTLVVTNNSPRDAGTAGTSTRTPRPTTSQSTPQSTPQTTTQTSTSTSTKPTAPQTGGTPQAKVGVDLGAVPQDNLSKVAAECQFPNETAPSQLVWSRKVRGITKDSIALVALAVNPSPKKPATSMLGYRYCLTRLPASAKVGSIGTVGRVEDKPWRARPTATRGLIALGGSDTDFTGDVRTLQAWRIYRALPGVAKVEARYLLDGKTGPWTSGVVDGGFAYTEVQATGKVKFTVGQKLDTEVRAFDANGRQIPIS
jgi:hypothetical protein